MKLKINKKLIIEEGLVTNIAKPATVLGLIGGSVGLGIDLDHSKDAVLDNLNNTGMYGAKWAAAGGALGLGAHYLDKYRQTPVSRITDAKISDLALPGAIILPTGVSIGRAISKINEINQ